MVNSFKIRHATHLSLKYLALATAWIDAGTKGNPETIKGIGQTWCFWFQFHVSLPLTASLVHKTYMWNPSFHNCNPITLRTLAWRDASGRPTEEAKPTGHALLRLYKAPARLHSATVARARGSVSKQCEMEAGTIWFSVWHSLGKSGILVITM